MKSKQTLKVGDRVKIKKSSQYFEKQGEHGIGEITKHFRNSEEKLWYEVEFKDGYCNDYKKKDLQLLPKKEVKKWKYTREQWVKKYAYMLEEVQDCVKNDLLAKETKSTPKKKSKEIDKKEDPKEKTPRDCIVCGKTIYEDYDSCINVCNQCANNKTKLVKSKEIKEIDFENVELMEFKEFYKMLEIPKNCEASNTSEAILIMFRNQCKLIRNQKKLQDTINLLIKNK